ncbi:MAG: NAD(P)/FAD-dependent oxidoreductase [Steroidobacteraceae bacterium]
MLRKEGDMIEGTDVLIAGGGLAGLTLALQLKQRLPALDIVVLERRKHPVPAATHKVGESSVEIGADYFETVLGLGDHLTSRQLRKFGFRFFFSDGRRDVDNVLEVGQSRYLSIPTYQIDRGIFENFLAEQARAAGAKFIDGAVVRTFTLGGGARERDAARGHHITYEQGGEQRLISARWLVDASGRAGLLKRHLGLAEPNAHDANAVWFRIGARIDVDDWSDDAGWLARCDPRERWLSTNHLVGEGYWVWLIPLASGSHSVGIVADARMHPLAEMNSFERAMGWLHRHQPRLAESLEALRGQLRDFAFLRGYSYGCKQVFAAERWAITGDAGVFLDPFYSPGGDFIAIANTYITELVSKDLEGARVARFAKLYERVYFDFYRIMLSIYVDQYAIFGDPEVMPVKVIWDYAYYWGILCQLFFQRRLTDAAMLARLHRELAATRELNEAMQPFLRAWSRVSRKRNDATMIDQAALGWFAELNRGLRDTLDDAGFDARIRESCALLHGLAAEIIARAGAEHPALACSALRALIGQQAERTGPLPQVPLYGERAASLALAG